MYGKFLENMGLGLVAWGGAGTCKVALVKAAYTPDQDTDEVWADVSGDEISGTNYTAGGKAITWAGNSVQFNNDNDPGGVYEMLADDVLWANLTTASDIKYAVVYYNVGSKPLIGYITLPIEQSRTGQDFSLEWVGGILGSIRLSSRTDSEFFGSICRLYAGALRNLLLGNVVWGDSNWKMALLKTTYSPNQDTELDWDDVSGNEVTGTNYAKQTLTFPSPEVLYSAMKEYFKADDVTFANISLDDNIQWAVVYYDVGSKPLLGYVRFDGSVKPTTEDLTIEFDTHVVFMVELEGA